MATPDDILASITNEATAADTTDSMYNEFKEQWEGVHAAYVKRRGFALSDDSKGKLMGLLKKFGPKIATYAGLPGAGAIVTALSADEGGFSGIMSKIPLLGSLFG